MPSLLDFLNNDDARLGIGLLAAAGPQTDPTKTGFGNALQSAMAEADARKRAALQNQYLQSQIADTSAQADARRQELALKAQEQAWRIGLTAPGSGAAPGAAPSADMGGGGGLLAPPSAPSGGLMSYGGQPVPGGAGGITSAPVGTATGPSTPQAAAAAQALAPEQKSRLQLIHERTGADLDAMIMDTAFNQAKGLGGIIKEATEPKWQPGPGGVNQKRVFDPQTQQWTLQVDPGGVNLYGQVKEADKKLDVQYGREEYLKGGSTVRGPLLMPPPLYGPGGAANGPPITPARTMDGSTAAPAAPPAVGGGAGMGAPGAMQNLPPPVAGAKGNFVGDPAQIAASIAGLNDPQERSNAMAALSEQIGREGTNVKYLRGSAGSASAASAPAATTATTTTPANPEQNLAPGERLVKVSPQQAAQDAADAASVAARAGDQQKMRSSIMADAMNAPQQVVKFQRLGQLYGDFDGGKLSQTGFDIASSANSLGIKLDKNLPNKEAAIAMSREMALQLRNPAGGAGMPGSLSNSDRDYLATMTPNLEQSAAGRAQIIHDRILLEQRSQQVATMARAWEKANNKPINDDFYGQLAAWSEKYPLYGKRGS